MAKGNDADGKTCFARLSLLDIASGTLFADVTKEAVLLPLVVTLFSPTPVDFIPPVMAAVAIIVAAVMAAVAAVALVVVGVAVVIGTEVGTGNGGSWVATVAGVSVAALLTVDAVIAVLGTPAVSIPVAIGVSWIPPTCGCVSFGGDLIDFGMEGTLARGLLTIIVPFS